MKLIEIFSKFDENIRIVPILALISIPFFTYHVEENSNSIVINSEVDVNLIKDPLEKKLAFLLLNCSHVDLIIHEPGYIKVADRENKFFGKRTLPDFLVTIQINGVTFPLVIEVGNRSSNGRKHKQLAVMKACPDGYLYVQLFSTDLNEILTLPSADQSQAFYDLILKKLRQFGQP